MAMLLMNPYEQVNRRVEADRRSQRSRESQPSRSDRLTEDARAIIDELRDLAHAAGRPVISCPGCGGPLTT